MWPSPAEIHDLDDEEHFTAQHMLAHFLDGRGIAVEEIGVADTVVCTFLTYTWKRLLERTNAERAPHWVYPHDLAPLAHGQIGGRRISLARLPQGAPAATMVLEGLIAAGARRLLVLGAAGSLQERAPAGSLVVPDAAIREEGTSFHYVPPGVAARPDPELLHRIADGCRARGVEPVVGENWTTDAIFREFKKKVLHYRARDVISVEMEASALFSVAAFRGVQIAFLLVISDELFHTWTPAFAHDVYRDRLKLAQDVLLDVAAALPDAPAQQDVRP